MKALKKEVQKQKRRCYVAGLLGVAALDQILWLAYDIIQSPGSVLYNVACLAVLWTGIFFVYKKYLHLEQECRENTYDAQQKAYLEELSERYVKRRLNGIALFFAAVAMFLLSEISFAVQDISKPVEIAENVFLNLIVVKIPLYLCIKNRLISEMLQRRAGHPRRKAYEKHLAGVFLFSAIYWAAVTAAVTIFRKNLRFPVNTFLLAGILFLALMALYNLEFRKRIVRNNLVLNRQRVAVFTLAAVWVSGYQLLQKDTWYTQPYINSVPVIGGHENGISYCEDTGVYTITSSSDDFKILHLTDIHLGGSLYSYQKDMKALKACYAEIEHTKPDLVVVTGDLTFPLGIMSLSLNNTAPVGQFAAFMRNLGIPWCFTYGNHDTESFAGASAEDLGQLYRSLSYKTSGTLLYPYVQPEITGRNNQLIEIRNSDGTLNTALFLIDSNSYTGEGINTYDYIHDDQVDWYEREVQRLNKEEGHTVRSLVFFHIPLQEYRRAYELYEGGSREVAYFFGENGEKTADKVCCSEHPSRLFGRMKALGSTTGVFCGHDHYNNISLEYQGIRLTYGMSIDYLAMPGIEDDIKQRGAELLTLHGDSSWDLEQVPLQSIMK